MGIDIIKNWRKFLSTPSARRATVTGTAEKPAPYISIHALREEGDTTKSQCTSLQRKFLSTPSARRATCFYNAIYTK